ncbi:MAG: hypothetical protein KC431_31945, partial [Myxococcales bacterium]|nr:hypothetical protein [Myxococcales bacterium]
DAVEDQRPILLVEQKAGHVDPAGVSGVSGLGAGIIASASGVPQLVIATGTVVMTSDDEYERRRDTNPPRHRHDGHHAMPDEFHHRW